VVVVVMVVWPSPLIKPKMPATTTLPDALDPLAIPHGG
jgi:hypothetical protein